MTKDCNSCKYSLHQDYGYSNYTVEGTEVYCLLGLNPELPMDRGWNIRPIGFAENCSRYDPSGGTNVDVDRDDGALENYSDDPEIKGLLRVFGR